MLSPWSDLVSPFALAAGAIAVLGALLISVLPRYRWLTAGIVLAILTPILLLGFLPNGQWGISDWDYYFSYHEVVRSMTLGYGEVPTWNPYICGGTSAVGDPEFPLFTPTFLLELIFGVPVGLRLAAMATTAIGGFGILALAHRLKLSPHAGFIAALAFSFGSVTILELVEGHPNVFSVMYIPWIFWAWLTAYLRSSDNRRASRLWALLTGALLAATFYQSGIYLLMYVAGAFVFLLAIVNRRVDALRVTITAGLWALGLAAMKLFPVLLWLSQFQDQAYASSASTLTSLNDIFLGRFLHGNEDVVPNQGGGWHEYGAYVGPFVLALVLVALARLRSSRVVRILLLGAALSLFISSSGPLLKPLFDQAPWLPRSNISRLVLFTVLPVSLLAGIGLDLITEKTSKLLVTRKRVAPISVALVGIILIGLVTIDVGSMSQALSKQAFRLTPAIELESAIHPIEYTIARHVTRDSAGVDHTRAYAATLAGFGTQSYCTVLGPSEPAVKTRQHHDENQSLLQVSDPDGLISLVSWKPNEIVAAVNTTVSADVVVNANFARGWLVNGEPAREISNRLAANVAAGEHVLTFSYAAPGHQSGRAVAAITLIGALAFLLSPTLVRSLPSLDNKVDQFGA